jgi:hypothetical protein
MGLTVIQENNNLANQRAVDTLAHDERRQFSLGIDDRIDVDRHVSLRTRVGLRQPLANNDFGTLTFKAIKDSLIDKFQIDATFAMMDRARVLTYARSHSRDEVFVHASKGFLERLKMINDEAFALIPAAITAKRLTPGSGHDIFGGVKPNRRRARLLETANDLYALIKPLSGDYSRVQGMESFMRVLKVFKERRGLVVPEGVTAPAVELKDPSEISPRFPPEPL